MTGDQVGEESVEAPGTRATTVRLEVDVRGGDRPDPWIVASPSLDDVAEALGSLDQRVHTEMSVIDGNGDYITVGGGRGRYHVYLGASDHDDRVVLQAPASEGGEEELVVDGRRQRYPARDVVDLDAAALAVLEFLRSGRPDPDLPWRTG